MRVLQAYGLKISTSFDFRAALLPADGQADLTLREGLDLEERELAGFRHTYSSAIVDSEGRAVFELHQDGDRELLRFVNRAEFLFDGSSIGFRPIGSGDSQDIETLFLSAVLAYWLERRGVLALHASAVVVAGRAVAFLAPSGGGKSSLAAAFLFAGHPILSDDIVSLSLAESRIFAAASYPEIKLNPDVGRRHLGDGFDRLRRFDPRAEKRCLSLHGTGLPFCADSTPLSRLFIVERRDGIAAGSGVAIDSVTRSDAAIEIIRSSYTPTLVEGVGLAAERLGQIAEVVRQVPVRRLAFDAGLELLPAVVESVEHDVRAVL